MMQLDPQALYASLLNSPAGRRGFDDRCDGQRRALDRFASDNDQMAYEIGHQVAQALMLSRGVARAMASDLFARVEMLATLFEPDTGSDARTAWR